MHLIVVTRPEFFPEETGIVNEFFRQGLERLHLRKPEASKQQLIDWLEQIDPCFYPRITLHDHHELVLSMHLGGVHLNARHPDTPSWWKANLGVMLSRSCHTIEEVQAHASRCDYLFLSPIFDSISKKGYTSAFGLKQLQHAQIGELLRRKVYALGGVTPERLPLLQQYGFLGAAVLGDIWFHTHPLERFLAYVSNNPPERL